MAFESKDDAKMQSEMANSLKKRNPVGNVDDRVFEREKMKAEVESHPDGIVVNWSDLARRHNITNTKGELAKNGGQIALEWLKKEGVDINRFKRKNDGSDTRVRRTKLRGQGGEITVATPQSIDKVKSEIRKKVSTGEFTVGQQIAPRKVSAKQYYVKSLS